MQEINEELKLKRRNLILYLGLNGFPSRDAGIQRQLQICKAIKNESTSVLVVNWKGVHTPEKVVKEKISTLGRYENVRYIYTSGTPVYLKNLVFRNFLKIVGLLGEFGVIIFNRIFNNFKCVIVKTDSLIQLKYYFWLTRVLQIKLVFDYLEFRSSLENRAITNISKEKSFDFTFYKYVDTTLIISHYLANHVTQLAPNLPYAVIPPIIDFEKFIKNEVTPNESNYFLYCGSTVYLDIMKFIINAYRNSKAVPHGISLILITMGDRDKIKQLTEYVKSDPLIKILSSLPYDELIGYYKSANALLIPLTDNLQDRARFPFKISEYTAAARPIVSSDSGAVINYFQNNVNALLAKTDDPVDYSSKLNFIIDYPEEAEIIAKKGHEIGLKYFNFKSYSQILKDLTSA